MSYGQQGFLSETKVELDRRDDHNRVGVGETEILRSAGVCACVCMALCVVCMLSMCL